MRAYVMIAAFYSVQIQQSTRQSRKSRQSRARRTPAQVSEPLHSLGNERMERITSFLVPYIDDEGERKKKKRKREKKARKAEKRRRRISGTWFRHCS